MMRRELSFYCGSVIPLFPSLILLFSDFYRSLARAGRDRGMVVQDNAVKITNLPSELESEIEEHFRCVDLENYNMLLSLSKPYRSLLVTLVLRHKMTQFCARRLED